MKGKIYNDETGNWISGGAAQMHMIKKLGGLEMFIGKIITDTAIATANATVNKLESRETRKISKPKLKRVK